MFSNVWVVIFCLFVFKFNMVLGINFELLLG